MIYNIKDVVSYKTAIALKALGFRGPSQGYYHISDDLEYSENSYEVATDLEFDNTMSNHRVAAPLLYFASQWIRENLKLVVEIGVNASGYYWSIETINGTFIKDFLYSGPNDGGCWDSYESALDEGLYQALNVKVK